MKRSCLLILLCVIFINSFAQNVGIGTVTPITKLHVVSTGSNVATFSGANQMYITLAEGINNRGYIGSFAGNPEDVDFGTYGGNTTGKLHLTIQDIPKLTVAASGNIGIGTTTPLSLLHATNGSVLFDGSTGNTPVSGAGSRLMWIPAKGAFRAGTVDFSSWDDANIGLNSVAMGYNTIASGNYSTAVGNGTSARGDYSTAMGLVVSASGQNSIAMGSYLSASGDNSIAMGEGTSASGYTSTAMGDGTSASGNKSTAMGYYSKSKSFAGLVIGTYNDSTNAANLNSINPLNRLFQIGNGTADNARSNVMTVLQNGNVGMGTTNPLTDLHIKGGLLIDSTNGTTPVSGSGRRLMWIPAKGAFRAGNVTGNNWDDINIGTNSFAVGENTKATALASTAMGLFTTATGNASTALGYLTFASTTYSTAMGVSTEASGYASTSIGLSTTSKAYGGLTIGLFNDTTDSPVGAGYPYPFNRIFQIGNGTANNARSNAMTVLQNGNVGIGILNPSQMLEVAGNVTVQNGKGIIRSNDGTQQKKVIKDVLVNLTLTAGASAAIAFTFPETFSAAPDTYVGNIIGGVGGWAEVVMSVSNITTTGGFLYVFNPRGISWSPNYTVRIIAIGPQ